MIPGHDPLIYVGGMQGLVSGSEEFKCEGEGCTRMAWKAPSAGMAFILADLRVCPICAIQMAAKQEAEREEGF